MSEHLGLGDTLVAAPELAFTELAARLEDLGWHIEEQSTGPLRPGEPELAVFRRGAARLHYSFNPVLSLRVLQFHGPEAAAECARAARQVLPLDAGRLRALLHSGNVRDMLLGLVATEQLGEVSLLDRVEALTRHPEPHIAQAAAHTKAQLGAALLQAAWQRLVAQTQRGRSALLAALPAAELRCQVLRWLMRENETANEHIDRVLATALADPDAEVRVTAMLAAGRLKARGVLHAVRHAAVPRSTSEGADPRDRLFYARLQTAIVRYLEGCERPASEPAGPAAPDVLVQALRGTLAVQDDPTLLLHALTTPLALGDPPQALPPQIERAGLGYRLRRSGIELCWVAPVPHWLGEGGGDGPNPVRRVTPERGFFIAARPLDARTLARLPGGGQQTEVTAGGTPYAVVSLEAAGRLCEALSALEGIEIALPGADPWEMTARGPDGRLFPWGNGMDRALAALNTSPWGVRDAVGVVGQWTGTPAAPGQAVVCGASRPLPCARRIVVASGEGRFALRPALLP